MSITNRLVVTVIIAELAILLGAMDQIAAVVDFFFLMCYAFVNLICALHSLLGAPNWRPRFIYYHWSVGCFSPVISNLMSLLSSNDERCFFYLLRTVRAAESPDNDKGE